MNRDKPVARALDLEEVGRVETRELGRIGLGFEVVEKALHAVCHVVSSSLGRREPTSARARPGRQEETGRTRSRGRCAYATAG